MYVLYLSTCTSTSQMQINTVNTLISWIRHGYFYRPYVHTITRVCRVTDCRQVLTGDMRILSPDAQSRGAGGAM